MLLHVLQCFLRFLPYRLQLLNPNSSIGCGIRHIEHVISSMFGLRFMFAVIDEAKCLELFGVTKAQALENMVAGLERSVNGELAKKAKKKANTPMRLCERAMFTTRPEIEPSVDDLIGGNG